jgi:hypothetical protein
MYWSQTVFPDVNRTAARKKVVLTTCQCTTNIKMTRWAANTRRLYKWRWTATVESTAKASQKEQWLCPILQMSRYPNCAKFPNHPCHTPAQRLTQNVRRSLRSLSSPRQELNPGHRVEGLGNLGKPSGEFGIVEDARELKLDTIVKRGNDRRMGLTNDRLRRWSVQRGLTDLLK